MKENTDMETPDQESRDSYRRITVRTTDGSNISGSVYMGETKRVSDLFTRSDNPFVILVDFEHRSGSGKVIFVNKSQIVWVWPEDQT